MPEQSAFAKVFGGTMGCITAIGVVVIGGGLVSLLMCGGCFSVLDNATQKAREEARKSQAEAEREAELDAARNDGQAESATSEGEAANPDSPDDVASVTPTEEVTLATFNRIQTGMSFKEVTDILGPPDQLLSENNIGGVSNKMYQWDADSGGFGANMNAIFQDDKLVQKAQFGLK